MIFSATITATTMIITTFAVLMPDDALPPADDFPRVQRVLISRPEDVRAGLEACV